jgi:hypothetical protein
MRTTVRIDEDLIAELKQQAQRQRMSLNKLLNRVIREGLSALAKPKGPKRKRRQATYALGEPRFNLDKALSLAASLDDEETIRKLALRK